MAVLDPLRDSQDGPEVKASPPAERYDATDLAEARQEVLDWVDGWLARYVPWSLRESLWEAGRKRYDLKEE